MSRTGTIDENGNFILDDDMSQEHYCPAGKCECEFSSTHPVSSEKICVVNGSNDRYRPTDDLELCPWPSRQQILPEPPKDKQDDNL